MVDDLVSIRENINKWKENKEIISEYFQKRETKLAKEPMMMYTGKFIESLFLLNHQRVENTGDIIGEIRSLNRKPLNVEERLSFILDLPNHYHSYIQLKELFVELEKLTARYQVVENRNK